MEPEFKKVFGAKPQLYNKGTKYFSMDTNHVSLDTKMQYCRPQEKGGASLAIIGPPDCDNGLFLSKESLAEFMESCNITEPQNLEGVAITGFYEYCGGVDLHYRLKGIQKRD